MLGIRWCKQKDKINIEISFIIQKLTKINILKKLVTIYHVLRFMSPCTFKAKKYCVIVERENTLG